MIGPKIAVAIVVTTEFPTRISLFFRSLINEWIASFKEPISDFSFLDFYLNHWMSFETISLTSSARSCKRTARMALFPILKASSF